MSPKPPTIIETLSLTAPLGLRFHDAATGEIVGDGLDVTVYPTTADKNSLRKRTRALPNRVGVYVLHEACGLEDFIRGKGDAAFWRNNPPRKSYIVEVFDNYRRFQPFRFSVELPVRGIYQWDGFSVSSPGRAAISIPLYSSPTRAVSGGMAVIRADLRESNGQSAAWAVLEARFNGLLIARGIANRAGKIALVFPQLPPQSTPLASPPASATRIVLADQQWQIDLTLKYQPRIFNASPPVSGENEELFPDLRLALSQANGTLWADAGQTEVLTTAALRFGEELVLRSRAAVASPATEFDASVLYVSPAV